MAPQPIPNTPPQSSKAGTTSTLSGLPPLDGGTTTIDDKLTFEVELECYRRLHELTSGCPGRDRYALSHRLRATCLFLDEALRKGLQAFATRSNCSSRILPRR